MKNNDGTEIMKLASQQRESAVDSAVKELEHWGRKEPLDIWTAEEYHKLISSLVGALQELQAKVNGSTK